MISWCLCYTFIKHLSELHVDGKKQQQKNDMQFLFIYSGWLKEDNFFLNFRNYMYERLHIFRFSAYHSSIGNNVSSC